MQWRPFLVAIQVGIQMQTKLASGACAWCGGECSAIDPSGALQAMACSSRIFDDDAIHIEKNTREDDADKEVTVVCETDILDAHLLRRMSINVSEQ